jgi:hypothetical protein
MVLLLGGIESESGDGLKKQHCFNFRRLAPRVQLAGFASPTFYKGMPDEWELRCQIAISYAE